MEAEAFDGAIRLVRMQSNYQGRLEVFDEMLGKLTTGESERQDRMLLCYSGRMNGMAQLGQTSAQDISNTTLKMIQ